MKIKHLTLFAFLFLGMEHCSYAQENSSDNLPMVELSANTKTYHLDRMGFEPNETLIYVINHLKESAGVLLVNGEEYNQDMTTFLSHTLVGQVESIQFITDINAGTSTIGAYINVILKKSQDGTHGRVDFSIDTKGNHTPTASIYHKKGKWSFWANATGNIQDSKSESSNTRYFYSKLNSSHSSTEEIEQHTFSGNFGMEYRSDKDIFKFRITEYHSPKDSRISRTSLDYDTHTTITTEQISETEIKNNLFTSIDYTHIFSPKVSLCANISEELINNPQWTTTYSMTATDFGNDQLVNYVNYDMATAPKSAITDAHSHSSSTSFKAYADIRPFEAFNIKAGVKGEWMKCFEHSCYSYTENEPFYTQYIPFAQAGITLGKWTLGAGERVIVNHNSYISKTKDIYNIIDKSTTTDDYTLYLTNANAIWTPCKNHQVQAAYKHLDGKYKEPECDIDNDEFNLNYTYSGKKISAGLYSSYREMKFDYKKSRPYNYTYKLYTIAASANATFNRFSIAGNVKFQQIDINFKSNSAHSASKDNYSTNQYITVSLDPSLSLPYGFQASAHVEYYYEDAEAYKPSDKWWCTLRLSKKWKHFDAFVKWENPFNSNFDRKYESDGYSFLSRTNEHINQVTFGGSYKF